MVPHATRMNASGSLCSSPELLLVDTKSTLAKINKKLFKAYSTVAAETDTLCDRNDSESEISSLAFKYACKARSIGCI
jgi:hypothetical protein